MKRDLVVGLIGLAIGSAVGWFAPFAVQAVFVVVGLVMIGASGVALRRERGRIPQATARRKGGR